MTKKVHVCDELTVCFRDAGHLLGSSFIEMWAKEEENECKLIFSGDIGNGNRALIRDPENSGICGLSDYGVDLWRQKS